MVKVPLNPAKMNALLPIFVTLSGIIKSPRILLLENALAPIDTRELGRFKGPSKKTYTNALSQIETRVLPGSNVIVVNGENLNVASMLVMFVPKLICVIKGAITYK